MNDESEQTGPKRSVSFKNKIREHWKSIRQMNFDHSVPRQQQQPPNNSAANEPTTQQAKLTRNISNLWTSKPFATTATTTTSQSTQNQQDSERSKGGHNKWGATFLNIVVEVLKFKRLTTSPDEPQLKQLLSVADQEVHMHQQREWFQLGGHQGTFLEGRNPGWVMKLLYENEYEQYKTMQNDVISSLIPKYAGVCVMSPGAGSKLGQKGDCDTNRLSHSFIEMEDLLAHFKNPNVMDVKMGIRTYLEEELDKCENPSSPRKDLFLKMISIDETQPTDAERENQAVLKSRYMIWRENLSSTATLGFRIEAIKRSDDETRKEYHRIRSKDDITSHIDYFVNSSASIAESFKKRLCKIRTTLLSSKYFKTHEFIGSSLLFVYDENGSSGVWMIDFAKTHAVPGEIRTLNHTSDWKRGNHEDGYLLGLDNLISIFSDLSKQLDSDGEIKGKSRRRSSIGSLLGEKAAKFGSISKSRQSSKRSSRDDEHQQQQQQQRNYHTADM